jgi:hypothetical protein
MDASMFPRLELLGPQPDDVFVLIRAEFVGLRVELLDHNSYGVEPRLFLRVLLGLARAQVTVLKLRTDSPAGDFQVSQTGHAEQLSVRPSDRRGLLVPRAMLCRF